MRPRSDPDEEPLTADPATVLALLEREQLRATHALEPDARLVYGVWGAAWVIGFSAMWIDVSRHRPAPPPSAISSTVFGLAMAAAMALSTVHIVRRTSGVRGPSALTGAMIGWAWMLAFAALIAIMHGVQRAGAGDQLVCLLWPVLSGLVVGALYMLCGAVWQDRVQYGFGVWVLVASAAGALAGYPGVYLVMAFAGGGGFLLAAAYLAARGRRAPGGPDAVAGDRP